MKKETYISVDIETSGPVPADYSILSLGACIVGSPSLTFYREFKPVSEKFLPEALAVSGLQLAKLQISGSDPTQAMREFKDWIQIICSSSKPVFVGLNAPFDWSFVNYYFHHFLNENPFGFSALDIKAFFMGFTGCSWDATRSSQIAKFLNIHITANHNALQDALLQASVFEQLRKQQNPSIT